MSHTIEELWSEEIDEALSKPIKLIIDTKIMESRVNFPLRIKIYNKVRFIPYPVKLSVMRFMRNCIGASI